MSESQLEDLQSKERNGLQAEEITLYIGLVEGPITEVSIRGFNVSPDRLTVYLNSTSI
jgi:hypothetical protein